MSIQVDNMHQPSVLEQMRAKVQERRKPKLEEFSFMMPEFKKLERDVMRDNLPRDLPFEFVPDRLEKIFSDRRREDELTANHFLSMKDQCDISVQLNDRKTNYLGEEDTKLIEPEIVNGYDGFSGVHDNLIWNPLTG